MITKEQIATTVCEALKIAASDPAVGTGESLEPLARNLVKALRAADKDISSAVSSRTPSTRRAKR